MKTRALYVGFSVGMTLVILGALYRSVSLAEVVLLIRDLDPRGLLMFLVFSLATTLCRTWRYALVLDAAGHRPGRPALFLTTIVRNTFSDLLPARIGSLVYVYITTTRLGVPFGASGASFALAFLFDLLALAPLIALAAVATGAGAGLSPWMVGGAGAVLAAVTVALLLTLRRAIRLAADLMPRFPGIGETRRARWRDALSSAEEDVRLAQAAGIYSRLFALSLLVRLFKYASLYVFLYALVAPLGYGFGRLAPPRVFLGLVASELAASLPISGIAGFGAYEGAWTLVFRLLVFPAHLAKLTSLAHHLFTQVYGYCLGAAALVLLLLPLFERAPAEPRPRKPVPAPRFALQVAAFCLGTAVLVAGLHRLAPAAPLRQVPAPVPAAATQPAPEGRPPVKGWVVYQRPDGIYKTRVEDGTTVRLADTGIYPRWSPDGSRIAFLRGAQVMVMRADGADQRTLATTGEPRCVAFHPDGAAVIFTDRKAVRSVSIADRTVRTLVEGFVFREPDLTLDGRLVASVRGLDVHIRAFDLKAGTNRRLARGCSASFSPDGRLVSQNGGDHARMYLRDFETNRVVARLDPPPGLLFDNQFWSNDADWIAGITQGAYRDVFVLSVPRNRTWRVTFSGSCDRPDLFVTGK